MPLSLSRRVLLTAAALTVALVSAAAPALAADPGSRPNNLTPLGTRLLFIADDGAKGFELWRTDGTTTTLLKDFKTGPQSGNPNNFAVAGSLMYLTGVTGAEATVWRTNGTRAGTIELSQIDPWGSFAAVGSRVYYPANDDHGTELWTSDGSVSGTKRITDIQPGAADGVWDGAYVAFGTRLAFFGLADDGSLELWTTRSTAGSAKRIKALGAGATVSWIRNAGGTLYLEIEPTPGTFELWKSDGTTAGTKKIRGLPAHATQPTAVGSTLFFVVSTDAAGAELWKTKGTTASTKLVKDIVPGTGSSDPYGLHALGTRLIFAATTGASDQELWRSDGTKAGTVRVKNINLVGPSFPDLPGVVIGGRSYFYADDGVHGAEPWRTDGTKAGTKLVGEVIPGAGGVYPGLPKVFGKVGSRVYFTADDGVHGLELWRTTSGGVKLWANIKPE